MQTQRGRFSLICSTLAVWLVAPAPAQAQLDIRTDACEQCFVDMPPTDIPLIRFLAEGTTLRAETRRSTEVVLFVAHASKGRIVSQGQTRPFRLDAKAASSSTGMLLGSALSQEQILGLASLARLGEAVVKGHTTANVSVSAAELLERPGIAFNAEDVRGLREHESVLLVAVVPADARMRARSKAGLLFVMPFPVISD